MQCAFIARTLLLSVCLCAAVSGCSVALGNRCDAGTTNVHITINHWSLITIINTPACPE